MFQDVSEISALVRSRVKVIDDYKYMYEIHLRRPVPPHTQTITILGASDSPIPMDLNSPFTSPPSSPDIQAFSESEEPVAKRAKGRGASRASGKAVTHCGSASELLRRDAQKYLLEKCRIGLTSWVFLARQTTVPKNIRSSDAQVLVAFQTIGSFILSESDKMLRRPAYVQLVSLLDSLVDNIATDRTRGFVHRAAGYKNTTIALDIYMSAQQRLTNAASLRRELLERKRNGQRWLQLAGPSPFTLILYSDVADQVMYVSYLAICQIVLTVDRRASGPDDMALRTLASEALQRAPPKLVHACIRLADIICKADGPELDSDNIMTQLQQYLQY